MRDKEIVCRNLETEILKTPGFLWFNFRMLKAKTFSFSRECNFHTKIKSFHTFRLTANLLSFQATLHSRSDGDGKCTVNSRQSQTSQTDLSVIEEEDNDDDEEKEEEEDEEEEEEEVAGESEGTAEMQRPAIETQTSQSPSTFVREVPCSHYVVDLSIPRRDYVINYNSNSRHDPPPPYSEM